ncbi:MAG: PQQ-binding-like beta-propeller repeat protein [Desulfobacteraceae bacterium]|jgi:outer membrane protein assembly factor BamB
MSTIRTILLTTAVIVFIFIIVWGIKRHRAHENDTDAGIAQTDILAPANPDGDWPRFHGNRAQSGYVTGRLPDKLSLVWRFKAGDEVKSSPAIVDGIVYVGSSDKHVYAIDIQTGKPVWSALLDDEIEASPTVNNNAVYIGTLKGTLYALDSGSGAEKWKFSTGDKIIGGANWFKDSEGRLHILAGSYDAVMYCIDARSGKPVWKYETGNFINGSPATSDKYCVFGGCDAVIHIISLSDGTKAGEIDTGVYIAASAAIKGDHVYVGNYDGELLKASLSEYKIVWRYKMEDGSFISSPAVTDDVVVIGGGDMNIHCVDNKSGQAIWTYTTLDAVDSSPVIVSDRVISAGQDGRLYMLDLADGKFIWSYETGRSITSSPAVANGMVVVGCDDGTVYCFK